MADQPSLAGAAFDAAVVNGTLTASLRFRSIVDQHAACCAWAVALQDASLVSLSPDAQADLDELTNAVAAFEHRGTAVVEGHRLVRWLALAARDSVDEHEQHCRRALLAMAVRRRDKSVKKCRQWLALPQTRRCRKGLVRALSQFQVATVVSGTADGIWHTHRATLANLVAGSGDAADQACLVMAGWSGVWWALGRDEPEQAAVLRRHLQRARAARSLDDRLARTLKSVDEPALWQCAGALQQQLNVTARHHDSAAQDAALLLRLPLAPRFGLTGSS